MSISAQVTPGLILAFALLWPTAAFATVATPIPADKVQSLPQKTTSAESPASRLESPIEGSDRLLSQVTIPDNLPDQIPPTQEPLPPSLEPIPEPTLPTLPPPEQLLPRPSTPPSTLDPGSGEVPDTVVVERFEVLGSTVFSPEQLAEVTDAFTNRPLSFAELLQARSAVTQLYVDNGYITSGAFIPPQALEENVVTIQVVEGLLEEVEVSGTRRLDSDYVRDRLEIAASTPLNVNRLLEGLQLLQLDPLIESLSADLQAGARPGTSILQVEVTEADTFSVDLIANNWRSPSVGSFRRQIQVSEANLLGFGDGISASYSNTDGSDSFDVSYSIPVNPRNGTLSLSYGTTSSQVIEPAFEVLEIEADSRYYEVSFRQPIVQTPTEEFTLGLTASRQESQTEIAFLGPFPLSPGADDQGRTQISALRFFQEWTRRGSQEVLAARSQFSLGLDALNSTVNEEGPDSRFFAWRGQGQWVRLLARDTLLLVRADVQLADGPLVPLEQFGLGGAQSIRGYRQDVLLTDSGALASAELRIPIYRANDIQGLLQVVPFFDLGTAWNISQDKPDPSTIAGIGVGLRWQQGDRLTARLDWGLPLVTVDSGEDRTLQEDGIYFSVVYTPF